MDECWDLNAFLKYMNKEFFLAAVKIDKFLKPLYLIN